MPSPGAADNLVGDSLAPRPRHQPRRPSFTTLKTTMAVTGTVMALFVVVHMVGNLKALAGPESYNGYAAWLREAFYPLLPVEGLLWVIRVVLAACVLAHVWAGTTLWLRGRAARGPFRRVAMRRRALATRSMLTTGAVVAVFVVVHLLDLTVGVLVAPSTYTAPTHVEGELTVSAYENLVASLSRPQMAFFYSGVMLALGTHLAQGLWNVVIDLGGTGARLRRVALALALAVAAAVALCNGALPLLVLAGVVK